MVAACLIDKGSLFHNIGAAIINAQSPVFFLVFSELLVNKIPLLLRRKLYLDLYLYLVKLISTLKGTIGLIP